MKKRIIVCGATGNQGGAVVRQLLQNAQFEVHALTRKTDSTASQALRDLGAKVIWADTADFASLVDSFQGAYGVFGVTQPWSADYKKCDTANEIVQGENIINAAKRCGVKHFILSSIINFDDSITGAPHVDSKLKLEHHLKKLDLPFTIVRCAQFMDNIGSDFFPVKNGKIKGFISPKVKVPYIACEDIGKYVAHIFCNPDIFINKQCNAIGDCISGNELATIVSDLRAEKFKYRAVPEIILSVFAKEFYSMRKMFERMGLKDEGKQLESETLLAQKALGKSLTVREFLSLQNY